MLVVDGIVRGYDWIMSKVRRDQGYAPVSTYYYDPQHPTSAQLDWDDDDDE
jgi:hypothetical protein